MWRYIKYILFLLLPVFVVAQNPVIQHMSKVSNLPDVEFYDIIEDHNHYIWLAADKGLYRYNGNNYHKFTNPNQKANSLFQLKLDEKGKLWCNNIYGQIFYVENDILHLFYDASKLVKGQLSPFEITNISIRLFTVDGIYDIDLKHKNAIKLFEGISVSESTYNDLSYVIKMNENNRPSKEKQNWCQIKNGQIKLLITLTSKYRMQSPKVYAFKNSALLNFKEQGKNQLYIYKTETDDILKLKTPKLLEDLTIYNITSLNNDYWFLTTSGVFIFQLKDQLLFLKEQLFSTESVTDVQIDFNNNYWFTTLDNGVFVSPNLNIRRVELSTFESKITASLALQNNHFVLGTNDGKLLFYNQNQLIKTLLLPGKKIIGKLYFESEKEQLIVSINDSESFVVDLKTDKITDVKNRFSVAKTFSKINDSTLFYGNYRQAIVYKKAFNNSEKQILKESRVKASVVSGNALFVSYIDGLYKYNCDTFSSEEIQYNSASLLVNAIANSNGTIWLETQHNGLLKYEQNSLQPSIIKLPENLQINTILSDGWLLWIGTDSGLYQYHTKTNELKSLSAQDGLNTAVNSLLVLENQLVVVLPNGFYTLPKENGLFKTFKTATVRVEAVSINDRDTLVASSYKLPYDFNKIGLKFNSNGFQTNQHVNYQYRIKEIDSSWQNVPLNTHFVNFNSLSSGTYTFELKAQNISAKNPVFAAPITFVIAKPFWETYWFYALVLLTVFGLIWLYFRWRLQQKEAQRIAEVDKILINKKITKLRLENLRSQMNPHFIFNALNSIQDYIISKEKELASSYLVKFSRLIRMYLDYSQQDEITLEEELNALKLYLELEKVRFEDELEYAISVDNKLKTKQIKVPSLFIQPYVENALKHGLLHKLNDRKLYIEAKIIQQNKLEITVEDNGFGREQSEKLKRPNQQHKPFATKANEERVHLYKNKLKRDITITTNDLYDENDVAAGTKVIITMPIH